MPLIRGINQLTSSHCPSVVSIGNYDGVHLGHQHVIATLLAKSRELNVPSTVVTFEPLAKEFFRLDPVMRLTSIEQRAALLFGLGIDHVLCIDFNAEFAAYSPQGFVQDVLLDGLGVQYLCVGDDFRFGMNRAGDFKFLQKEGVNNSFEVTAHDTFTFGGERVSSGRVREALHTGDFALAAQLLGRPYTIDGEVSKGQQLGRTINYPTANIVLPNTLLPVNGVYAVTVTLNPGRHVLGVANVGRRPTVDGKENRLEVHLFDFDDDIYGQRMSVEFHHKVRDEQKFESIDTLKEQIAKDAQAARKVLISC